MLRAKPCELKSKLTAKGIGRETSKMRERLPASAATLTEPPRRRAFEPGEAGEAAWCTEMGNLSGTAFTEFRSPRTSYEYDVYTWAVNEYCIRQGHGSYVEVVEAGQSATSCSSTGFLKPTYDEQGRMKVHEAGDASRGDHGHGRWQQGDAQGWPQRRPAVPFWTHAAQSKVLARPRLTDGVAQPEDEAAL